MDTDPLSDTVPPRYAVESDEEDEFNPLSSTRDQERDHGRAPGDEGTVDVKVVAPDVVGLKAKPMIVASGQLASFWAAGAQLGEQIGAVFVNNVQVGMLFTPGWTPAVVLISETTTALPSRMMHSYASKVVEVLTPSSTALLDIYPHHAYITASPLPFHLAPIRYLSLRSSFAPMSVERFETPNLITSTSAAFMAILATQALTPATLLLLPSPRIPPPPPRTLSPSHIGMVFNTLEWSQVQMQRATDLLHASGDPTAGTVVLVRWKATAESKHPGRSARRVNVVGEGSMYI
ncbi:hypothetical protein PLEOSDRAFT_52914 [Pleurotus ostreatus PC15]|uniref:Proteasome assembly chaperone 1 n=1 Tax=Pleurotus ostreatus (strain PC15) TaxID=1137138 RepID=A0A067N8U9_PLEO1|nr:hypothetical protein PLEOSDRAFT_52914 [Pleurotus ostreatus PC15]